MAPAGAAAACPNEALRLGPSSLLPECRAYEMVSPVDKNGSNVNQTLSVRATGDGDAVGFWSTAAFPGNPSSPLENSYVSRRGSENWATESLDAPQNNPRGFVVLTAPASSEDFSKTLQISKVALTPDAVENGSNIYVRDNLTGERTLVVGKEGNGLFGDITGSGFGTYVDGSADWSHILLRSDVPLNPEVAEDGQSHVYDYTGGQLHVVDVLPDGTVSPDGAQVGGIRRPYAHGMSEDGTRVFFTAATFGFGPLYMREDDSETVPISASQRAEDEGTVYNANFPVASADGSVVYFTSSPRLTEASAGNGDLYRYDVETGTLTDLTPSGGQVEQILAAAEDGSYVYFSADAGLTEGATEASGFTTNLYAWHAGQIKLIETELAGLRQPVASPDGHIFGFASFAPLTPDDVPSPACPADPFTERPNESCLDVYAFDFASGDLACVSCKGPGRGDSSLGGQGFRELGTGDHYPHAILDDGTVFIDTPNRLLPRDVNGVGDVYAWREGEVQLISTGMGDAESTFGDSALDRSDIFFRTAEGLVKQDTDQNIDLYDARVGGGLMAQYPPGSPGPCEGEGCRSDAPPAADFPSAGSADARGEGNLPNRCARLIRKAKAAERKARRLRGQRARQQQRKARRLKAKARNCGGQG